MALHEQHQDRPTQPRNASRKRSRLSITMTPLKQKSKSKMHVQRHNFGHTRQPSNQTMCHKPTEHNHDAEQNQQRCEKEARTSATPGIGPTTHVGSTFARSLSRSQSKQTSHIRRDFGVALLFTMTMSTLEHCKQPSMFGLQA